MRRLTFSLIALLTAPVLIGAVSAFAEAPVYDVDAVQEQYDSSDDGQDVPPPPPESGFVPAQTMGQGDSLPPSPPKPRSENVNAKIKSLEQEVKTLRGSEANARAESLQNEVQSLRNQVEQLTHQLDNMKGRTGSEPMQQDGLIADGSDVPDDDNTPPPAKPEKVKATAAKATAKAGAIASETKPVDAPATTTVASKEASDASGQPNVAEEQQIYQNAYDLIKAKKYSEAADILQGMLKKYPSGQFAANAHYWLGELYVLMDKNGQALKEFNAVVENYPRSPRVSDAQLKVGIIYAAQANWTDAKSSFNKVINHYPGTASSRVASEQLKQIKQAGH